MSGDGLLPDERKVLEQLGHLPLDFRAMWAISNLFRSSAAIRRHMEAKVLAPDRLSWTSFVGLWVLWVWGELGANAFADAVGISRPTATGVLRTLEGRGWATRRKDPADGRGVLVSLTPKGRSNDRAAINAAIGEITQNHTAEYWINLFDEAGIPCGPIYSIDQVFADPQVQHLGMATPMHRSAAAGGDTRVVASPLNFSGLTRDIRLPTPEAGDHTDEVLGSVGYSEAEIAAFRAKGIV